MHPCQFLRTCLVGFHDALVSLLNIVFTALEIVPMQAYKNYN